MPGYFIPPAETSFDAICTNPTSFTDDGAPLPNLPAPGSNYQCVGGHKLHGATTWLGLAGFLLMVVLMSRGFRGAIVVGVLFSTIIAWIPGHSASYLGKTSNLPGAAKTHERMLRASSETCLTGSWKPLKIGADESG